MTKIAANLDDPGCLEVAVRQGVTRSSVLPGTQAGRQSSDLPKGGQHCTHTISSGNCTGASRRALRHFGETIRAHDDLAEPLGDRAQLGDVADHT